MSSIFNNQNNLKIFLEDTIEENQDIKYKVIITNYNISNIYYLGKEQLDRLKSSGMFNVEEITSKTNIDSKKNFCDE